MKIIPLHVSENLERRLRRQYPWIFSKYADFGQNTPELGDLIAVYGKRNKCIAIGLYDPHSPICVRLLGKPADFSIDYLIKNFDAAVDLRVQSGIADAGTNALRLLSGESEGLPAMVVDAYAGVWVLKVYSSIWLPHLNDFLEALVSKYFRSPLGFDTKSIGGKPERLILRFSRDSRKLYEAAGFHEGETIFGEDGIDEVAFLENDARFLAHVIKGQKTGFFLDQRDNRRQVRSFSEGRKVLDICCFSGGFSINAALGGARSVWSLDADSYAIDLVGRHYTLNASSPAVAACERVLIKDNMFLWLEKAKEKKRFDLIIVDPPNFASSQNQIATAEKAYARLFSAAADCLNPKGSLLCCSCSSHIGAEKFGEFIDKTLRHRISEATDLTALPADHVANFAEAKYLKTWLVQIK